MKVIFLFIILHCLNNLVVYYLFINVKLLYWFFFKQSSIIN